MQTRMAARVLPHRLTALRNARYMKAIEIIVYKLAGRSRFSGAETTRIEGLSISTRSN